MRYGRIKLLVLQRCNSNEIFVESLPLGRPIHLQETMDRKKEVLEIIEIMEVLIQEVDSPEMAEDQIIIEIVNLLAMINT